MVLEKEWPLLTVEKFLLEEEPKAEKRSVYRLKLVTKNND
tara:strand:+ start:64 stop:183 length:120 start_codon:yes stop_codon:yes gene_type:complete